MAIVSYGYEGTMSEAAWAVLGEHIGTNYGVDGFGGWRVSIGGSGSRAVTVEAGLNAGGGVAFGWGVADLLTADAVLNATTVSSGTRWDTVVARRNWQPSGGGTTTLAIVAGGSTQAIAAGLNNQPGVICDQPLALIRCTTSATVQEVINLRASSEKVETFVASTALPAGAPLGKYAVVLSTGDLWHRRRNSSGTPIWFCMTNPDWTALSLATGYAAHSTWVPRYRKRLGEVELRGGIERTNGASFGTTTNGATLATLPAGLRPPHTVLYATAAEYDSAGCFARIEIRDTGEIIVYTPSAETHGWVGLDGVRFAVPLDDGSIVGLSV